MLVSDHYQSSPHYNDCINPILTSNGSAKPSFNHFSLTPPFSCIFSAISTQALASSFLPLFQILKRPSSHRQYTYQSLLHDQWQSWSSLRNIHLNTLLNPLAEDSEVDEVLNVTETVNFLLCVLISVSYFPANNASCIWGGMYLAN